MAEGSFRVDANVSVRPKGQEEFGTRAELKNINSFRFLERGINFEVERQIDLIEDGGTVVQETRLYDANKDETRSMRSKEEANDYRYFPDPDLLPVEIDQAFMDAVVSEQLARMVAMKAATDAAGKQGKSLKRQFNRARQTAITTELSEIIGGAAALE